MVFSGLSFIVSFSFTLSLHFCTPFTVTLSPFWLFFQWLLFVILFNFTVLCFFPWSNFLYTVPFPSPCCCLQHLYFKFNLFIILLTVYLTLFHFRLNIICVTWMKILRPLKQDHTLLPSLWFNVTLITLHGGTAILLYPVLPYLSIICLGKVPVCSVVRWNSISQGLTWEN